MPDYQFTTALYPKKVSSRVKILTGQRFYRLLVLGWGGMYNNHSMWHCLCDCGTLTTQRGSNLGRQGDKAMKSCGCWRQERSSELKHGACDTPEYRAYSNARYRCNTSTCKEYPHYGGRGIEFRFTSFLEFLDEIGYKPTPKHTLERVNNNGHYEKGNVVWATSGEQNRNQRNTRWLTAFGETRCATDWATDTIANYTIGQRIDHQGWCVECAVSLEPFEGTCVHKTNNRSTNRPTHLADVP